MNLMINEYNLKHEDIQESNSKVRAFLVDENNNVLIANYENVILLPGGSINKNETMKQAIIRELKEETGINYSIYELEYLNTLEYYQKDYPKSDGSTINRLIRTHYFTGTYKGIIKDKTQLTEKKNKR